MHRSRMQYRIQGARMLTGGKSLFVNLPDKLQEVCLLKLNSKRIDWFERFGMTCLPTRDDQYRWLRLLFCSCLCLS
jgi:hypothetical protein